MAASLEQNPQLPTCLSSPPTLFSHLRNGLGVGHMTGVSQASCALVHADIGLVAHLPAVANGRGVRNKLAGRHVVQIPLEILALLLLAKLSPLADVAVVDLRCWMKEE